MRKISKRAKRVSDFDDRRFAGRDLLRHALKDHARGATAHGVSDKAVSIMTLALQGNKNRSGLSFARVRHNLTEGHLLSIAQDLAARGADQFLLPPAHSSRRLYAGALLRFFPGDLPIVKMDLLPAQNLIIFVAFARD